MSIRSVRWIRPRSPWTASPACKKWLRLPVEASVAAIFWPINPALPIPVTMTLPGTLIQLADRAAELGVEPSAEAFQRLGLDLNNLPGVVAIARPDKADPCAEAASMLIAIVILDGGRKSEARNCSVAPCFRQRWHVPLAQQAADAVSCGSFPSHFSNRTPHKTAGDCPLFCAVRGAKPGLSPSPRRFCEGF